MTLPRIFSIEELLEAIGQGYHPSYLFFWGHQHHPGEALGKACLSQWYPSPFTVDGITYPASEHYMMAEKARLFGDEEIRQKILHAPGPDAAQKLGRQVRGFDLQIWSQHNFAIVVQGNLAKFAQNPPLRDFLLSTADRVLVEASPIDTIWGIGLAEYHPDAHDPTRWKGQNLLGFALMRVRASLADSAA